MVHFVLRCTRMDSKQARNIWRLRQFHACLCWHAYAVHKAGYLSPHLMPCSGHPQLLDAAGVRPSQDPRAAAEGALTWSYGVPVSMHRGWDKVGMTVHCMITVRVGEA